SAASRLITGSLRPHRDLEDALADWKGAAAALSFGSGYATALGVIPALVDSGDIVILDRRVHACCVDAARLSGATLRVCRHNDLNHLESLLGWARSRPGTPRILIVTESVFSMDGDQAPLAGIVDLKERHDAWLMLDEAHAAGLFGDRRSGLAEALGLSGRIEIQMGTLGKALGAAGGYVCGSRVLVDHLVGAARSFLFSTAPVPAAAGAALAAIQCVRGAEGAERHRLVWSRIRQFAAHDGSKTADSAIVPVRVGAEPAALDLSHRLLEAGVFVPAIRYPTVARGQACLRVSFTASHTADDVARLACALHACGHDSH
ncbi:MAG: aminotransferase class I/II-fold pyridoxal phosphate-dependent enzyme, partial [Verrucomicrobiae bacterium]|nr:aminotransferase class I/II-fold pyridoxal phosphate-dependent enzyme [Verrucomicrobiae bacterium]